MAACIRGLNRFKFDSLRKVLEEDFLCMQLKKEQKYDSVCVFMEAFVCLHSQITQLIKTLVFIHVENWLCSLAYTLKERKM